MRPGFVNMGRKPNVMNDFIVYNTIKNVFKSYTRDDELTARTFQRLAKKEEFITIFLRDKLCSFVRFL